MKESDENNPKAAGDFPTLQKVRQIVLAHGWNSTSYQILNPGIKHWFSASGDAVVGFVSSFGIRVVVGAPICALNQLPEVAAEFERDAASSGERVCYLCAEQRLESLYGDNSNHKKILLGAQPVWQPRDWETIVSKHKSLRAQLNRARNKGVAVAEWTNEKAADNPALLGCLRRWLAAKGLPPLHFMVEPNTLSRLFDRRVFVAEHDLTVVGFVLMSPVAGRDGWLFEQFVHCPGAPNGTVELMIDAAMKAAANGGSQYVTLGLAPLSTRAAVAPFRNPVWLRIFLAWLRVHGKRFYNFDGLDAFKAKLQPEKWEPVFAISNEPRISPKTLYAIAGAFSQNAPVSLIFTALRSALTAEIKLFKDSFNKKSFK